MDNSCASDSRRSSCVATTTSSYSHSTSETRNSTSTNNMPPPIQGSFYLGSNSFNLTRPIGAWEEPRSDAASPYDDNLVSFSPIISETTKNKNYANPSRAASHGTLPTRHEDLVDLDLDGFLRSEHGSIRSTRAHGGGRDGLMRQVENSLVTGKQINIRRGLVWCAAIGVLLVVTISVSMAFSAGAATPQQLPPSTTATTTLQGPAESNNGCSVTSNIQQDPFWQCDCENAISSYDTAFMDTYNSLKNTWITTLIPNFNEKLDSCTPLNQALTWLSFDVTQNPQTQHDEYNDRFLLAFLYATWKGRGWKNNAQWVSNEKSCKWFGVECDSKGRIVGIWMTENNLMGSLPSELTLLTNLVAINLGYNHLSGSIPSEIGTLSYLEQLTLSVNFFKGTIPDTLGELKTIRNLELDFNVISGSIPSSLGKLSALEYLTLWDNQLIGSIPTEIGTMTQLKEFRLHNNRVTGVIPSEVGSLMQLSVFDAAGNHLKGFIPTELGLTALEILDLGNCGLTGFIPTELSKCNKLNTIGLSHNIIFGPIPSEFGTITSLRYLFLSDNRLTGTFPSQLGNLPNLQVITLQSNYLVGEIPTELGKLASLENLNLSGNVDLKGNIPDSLCGLRKNGSLLTFIANCGTCEVPTCCSQCA